ncbi:MAG: FAD-dependent oxidoreductase [Acidobacteriia bacterium]|nr:FAD-dependent oxidoreductase [Terriglobia bacterium]
MREHDRSALCGDLDALILGGGPAGATAAAVLAAKGRNVLVVEREPFPRYKVGESLLPYCYFPLERIGMVDKLRASSFVKKYSVQFAAMDGRVSAPFYFFQHFDHAASQTWQVVRSEFDQMMLDNAVEKGARVLMGATAKRLLMNGGRCEGLMVEHGGETFPIRAPVTIDCGGRHGFAATELGWVVPDPRLNKVAIWTYYRGALRDAGHDEGATTVAYLPGKGWFWYIPLPEDTVSVGVVAERDYLYREGKDLEAIFDREALANRWIAKHLDPGVRYEPIRVTAEYSYRSRYCAGDGLVLAGDAFTFLDPVFSSGVLLALLGGERAAGAVDAAVEAGDFRAARFAAYGADLCEGVEAMRKLVYAFYEETFSFGQLLKSRPDLRGDLTDCLIGNLAKDFRPLFEAVGKFASVPEPLPYGSSVAPAMAPVLAGRS